MSDMSKPKAIKEGEESQFAQSEHFEQAARDLGCDDDPAHFDAALKKVARHKPVDAPSKPRGDDHED